MNRHLWVAHNEYAVKHNTKSQETSATAAESGLLGDNLVRHLNNERCRPVGENEGEEEE